ncbi:uncharacterized protein LOC133839802 isoform X2 [Drosophila sulfurigaster albostrigata]|uniref:uncharacterized protein LOC133839802 isoform X2 n=1 Tax=Drosophila sulfurigaster albostrigata TaxID=89887 RepID=UPI002D21B7C4|nr:uncharacterized protein LOC133839802 isoform X2 [Drosophila sulfurigaster albostrigata]
MAAENYHLKWDSHLSYLNTSISTLYKNEKFADVVLYSSYNNCGINSDIPTVGISAHKFILSSCSQFFATMFDTAPINHQSPSGVFYIVLPPDLSHRAIQILVQYMYSGEATVSNDILNEVLRGGEMLKIRGLCRTSSGGGSSGSNAAHHGHHHGLHHQREPSGAVYISNGTRSSLAPPPPPPPPSMSSTQLSSDMYSNKASSSSGSISARYSLDHHHTHQQQHQPPHHSHSHHHHHQQQQQQQQFRGLGASVMPKDSPVIVKSPKMATHTGGLLSVATSSSKMHASSVGGISVNKEVAIDPEDKCCYAASSQVESLPQSTAAGLAASAPPPPQQTQAPPMSICTEVGCSSCPLAAPPTEPAEPSLRRPDYAERERLVEESLCERERDDVGLVYERRLRRERSCERAPPHEYFPHDPSHYEHVVKPYEVPPAVVPRLASSPPHPHSFLTIKQEPTDWSNNPPVTLANDNNNHEHSQEAPLSPKQPLDFKINAVKLEANASNPDDSEEHTLRDYNNFKVLICEICQKSFEDTKTLVRHLGTHAAEPTAAAAGSGMPGSATGSGSSNGNNNNNSSNTANSHSHSNLALRALKTYVPKKRRRVSVSAVGVAATVLDKPLTLPIPQQQENNMDHVTLLCDLCSTSFETPAEWVRHMNSQHTEIELAMFNSKKDGEQKGSNNSGSNINSSPSTNTTASISQLQHATVSSAAATVPHKKYINASRQMTISSSNSDRGATTASPGLTQA